MKYTLNLATRAYVNRRTLYLSYALFGALLFVVLLFDGGTYPRSGRDGLFNLLTHDNKINSR